MAKINWGRQYVWSAKPTKKNTVAISVQGHVCFMCPRDARDIVAEEKEKAKLRGTIALIWKMSKEEIRQHFIAEARTQKLYEMAKKAGEAWAKLQSDPDLMMRMLKGQDGGCHGQQ